MNLEVCPESVFLIRYPGGYCGEFLAWWLSQHTGCIKINSRNIGHNRYVAQHQYNYVYHQQGSKDLLFLTAHPSDDVSKIGLPVCDSAQHLYLYSSHRTHRFYFLLYLIKTVFYKYRIDHPPAVVANRPEKWQQFLQYLNGRKEFTSTEIQCWMEGIPCPDTAEIVQTAWAKSPTSPGYQGPGSINIDELFFGDYSRSYTELCGQLNLIPQTTAQINIQDYHQRNVELAEKYLGLDLESFLELDTESALLAIKCSMLIRANESYSLV